MTEVIEREVPFEYDITEEKLIVYKEDNQFVLLYYSPEIFDICYGCYDWKEYEYSTFCNDRVIIILDDRQYIRFLTLNSDDIFTVNELKRNKNVDSN